MAHTFGTASTRATSMSNPIVSASFTVDRLDTVLVLTIKTDTSPFRTGGAPTFAGRTMTQAGSSQRAAASPEVSCEMWYLLNPPAGSWTCSIPNGGAQSIRYTLATGQAKPGCRSALDVAGGTNGTSTNPGPGSLTTTKDGAIGFAIVASGATTWNSTAQAGTGYGGTGTGPGDWDDGAHGMGQQYVLQATAGALNLNWTFGTSDDWGAVAAFFREIDAPNLQNFMNVSAYGGGAGVSVTETGAA